MPPRFVLHFIIDCEASEIMHLVASVRLSVRLHALSRLNRLTYDLHLLHGGRPWPKLGWLCRSKVNVRCQKLCFYTACYNVPLLKGQRSGQSHGSRSNFWRAAVDIRGSVLPSAAKSNKSHYQSMVFVCVSLTSGCM